jgi:hypothetical protein
LHQFFSRAGNASGVAAYCACCRLLTAENAIDRPSGDHVGVDV